MDGVEVAWCTLAQEPVAEPCIAASWLMKGDYYSRVTGRDHWGDREAVFLKALASDGGQPVPAVGYALRSDGQCWRRLRKARRALGQPAWHPGARGGPAADRRSIPSDQSLERGFELEAQARQYAEKVRARIDATSGEVLFIDGYGQADFMGPYNEQGYTAYLTALALYPDHLRRYYRYTATRAALQNQAIVEAVERHGIAPFVYGGQDICANDGPLCSVKTFDAGYFPELRRAVQPLLENDIRIIWHCDGNIVPILDRLIDLGISGLQGFQEEAGVPYEQMVKLRTKWGEPMIVWGCVSVTTTLPFGTVADVKSAVERSFLLAGPGRGFVLASTSSIMPEVPDENIDALYQHGKAFGQQFLQESVA